MVYKVLSTNTNDIPAVNILSSPPKITIPTSFQYHTTFYLHDKSTLIERLLE